MAEGTKFFVELYRSEYDNIKKYVRRLITDTNGVEDIVQETFLEAYRKREELMRHPNVPGWLHLTAKNKLMKWEDKQKRYLLNFDFPIENTAEPEKISRADAFRIVEAHCTVRKILSEEELQLLRDYYEYGYTSQEMSKRLGITENCFKVRILRMKQKIRNSLLQLCIGLGGMLVGIVSFMGEVI